jgi:predicted lipoprotein with Yx(FWY)xxD motif
VQRIFVQEIEKATAFSKTVRRFLMKRLNVLNARPGLIGLLTIFSLIVAACSAPPAENTPASALPDTGSANVQIADNPEFGQILVTPDGKTLYTNTVDTPEDLRCTDVACTRFWPPFIVDAEPTAGEEIPGSLGTITRPDGSKQVTYNQQPLYTFYLDGQEGDTKGNGFIDLGGTWHVVPLENSTEGSNSGPAVFNKGG